MIRIASMHLIDPPRNKQRMRLNREWVELCNFGMSSIDIFGYVVTSSSGEKVALEPSNRTSIILPSGKSIVIFSGRPDRSFDPPGCYMENETERFFLCRTKPIWTEERDAAFLYPSMSAYLADPSSYLDAYHFSRHNQAKFIMGV